MTETAEQEQEQENSQEPQTEPQDQGQTPAERHVNLRTIVFPDLRILYVPVPKAGCTAILWALAKAAGLDEEHFYGSVGREVSRSLTIHDLSGWPDEYLYAKLSQDQKDEILSADDWLRFTVVRHPFRRLWSAWQSKIMLAEPQFIAKFSSRSWFPPSLASAEEILKMFRQFLEALEEDSDLVSADVHWAPQVPLTSFGSLPYTHVGRVEKMGETVERLRDHLLAAAESSLPDLPRANVTPLPYVNELFTESDAQILGRVFEEDLGAFEYEVPSAEALQAPCPSSWIEAVDSVTSALRTVRDRNRRIADLQQLFKGKREELNERITNLRERVESQKKRIEQQTQRIEDMKRRNIQQTKLRNEEQRRNERLQKRLHQASREADRLKSSASWRYTAPLRRLSRLGRKMTGRRRR